MGKVRIFEWGANLSEQIVSMRVDVWKIVRGMKVAPKGKKSKAFKFAYELCGKANK